jgi:hypothetical protein
MAYGDLNESYHMTRSERLRRQAHVLLDEANEREILEERFGTNDDWPDGVVISWDRVFFTNGGRRYTYVALKSGNRWFVTGKQGNQCLSMSDLVERHLQYAENGVWQVGSWEEV